jgi:hypothetical protein
MADGIGKAVGQHFEAIGKQIVSDLASIPKSIVGLDSGGTHETKGQGGGSQKSGQQQKSSPKNQGEQIDPLAAIRRQTEIEKQKQISEVRRRLEQLMSGHLGERPKTPFEEKQLEELEKQKQQAAHMKQEVMQLRSAPSKRRRGDLYGVTAKKFGGEQGKNVVSQ